MARLFLIFFILKISNSFCQNLVPNSSFENYSACPLSSAQASLVIAWSSPINNDADYFNSCSSNQSISVPHAGSGYQQAKSGSGFMGIYTYNGINNNYREYIRTTLTNSLAINQYYKVTFFCSSMGVLTYATNNIGLNFSNAPINSTGTGNVLNIPVHITKYNNPVISDSLNWIEISGIYQANGGEQYVTIGNFNSDSNTDTLNDGNFNYSGAYYYIDDVSVINITSPQWQYRDTSVVIGDSVLIGPAITGLNVDWYDMSNNFIKNAPGIYVKPTVTTSYKATETFNSVVYNHTVTVTVLPTSVKEYEQQQNSVNLFPNPNTGTVNLKWDNAKNGEAKVIVLDITGKVAFDTTLQITNGLSNFNLNLSPGTYLVKIINPNTNVSVNKKLMIQ